MLGVVAHNVRHYPAIPSQPPPVEKPPRRRHVQQHKVVEPDQIPQTTRNQANQQNPRFRKAVPVSARTNNSVLSPVIPNGPISPQLAIQNYAPLLTNFERTEINQFPEVFFLGQRSRKIEPNKNDKHNIGFDDSNNNYKIINGDHLAYRFEILSSFGAGAFGQVLQCYDHKAKKKVAVKVIVSTEQMHEQGQIEAKILAKLNKSNSAFIVRAFDFFIFRSHICITYEILGKNLYEISQANGYRPLPVKLVRQYAIEMLHGIEQCHRLGIVHCDLKPENVLVCQDNKSHCKLIDFGSSCFDGHQKYEYIQSRFYRAPEVMIGVKYGPPMDIWSFALIVVELLLGKPLFPGENELDQLSMIAEVLGSPNTGLVKQGKRRSEFFDENYKLKINRAVRTRKPGSLPLAKALKSNDPVYEDFISRCLTWDPIARTTASQLLQHPWLNMKEIKKVQKPQSMLPELRPQD